MALPDDSIIQGLLAFWEQARGERSMPAKADIDPVRLGPKLLPYILLVDAVDGGARFRYRLCGSANAQAAGIDLTGRHVDELNPNPDYLHYMTALYRRSMDAARPTYSESRYMPLRSATARRTRRLVCPIGDDGVRVERFISAQSFQQLGSGQPMPLSPTDRFEPGPIEVL
jgi:hypothetical protein